MLSQMFEPYRRENGSWDTWIYIGLQTALSGKTGEALVIGVIIVFFVAIVIANVFLLHQMGVYLWNTYRYRATKNDAAARALQAILVGAVLMWSISYAAFKAGNIGYALHVNIIGL